MMPAAPWGRNTGDPTGNALQIRGQQAWQNGQQQRTQDWYQGGSVIGAPPPITNVIPDSRWSGLLQALHEQGTDKLRSGAVGNMGDPGFFDTQDPRAALLHQLMQTKDRSGR